MSYPGSRIAPKSRNPFCLVIPPLGAYLRCGELLGEWCALKWNWGPALGIDVANSRT